MDRHTSDAPPTRGRFAAPSAAASTSAAALPASPGPPVGEVGPDESTAIRARPTLSPAGERFAVVPTGLAEPSPSISEMGLRP